MKNKSFILSGILFVLLSLLSLTAYAATIRVPEDYPTIQEAIDAASPGDTVLVAPGTYEEDIVMSDEVDVIGSGANVTIIDGGGSGSTVTGADNCTISKFTITNSGSFNQSGIRCYQSSPTITENKIINNNGEGISLYQSTSIITNNLIEGNYINYKNAISCSQSSPIIRNNIILAEDPNGNIDAIYMSYINLNMTESFLIENNTIIGGLTFSNLNSIIPLENVVRNNIILGGATALNIAFSSLLTYIINNTITNPNGIDGWGIMLQGNSHAVIKNNIITNRRYGIESFGSNIYEISYNNVWGNTVNYSSIPDQTGINGNISGDPLFVNASLSHYSLDATSPCIDTGDPSIIDPDSTVSNMGAFGGPEAKIVNLTLSSEQTQVQPGGTLEYTALLSNNFSDTPELLVGSGLVLPNGNFYLGNPIIGPLPVTLDPYETIEKQIFHDVPSNVPLGNYIYVGRTGTRESGIIDESSFDFEVIEPGVK